MGREVRIKNHTRYWCARGLEDVVFLGKVSYEDLPRYYATADIFCSPATGAESFGIVLLEAMAAGKPLIVSGIEGYSAVVDHGKQGLLFPRKDAGALANSLELLIRNPELRQKLGSKGRQAVEQYRWRRVASQVETYYQDLLGLSNGRAGKRTT